MTSTVKPKAKFPSRNLSAVYKAPASATKPTDHAGGFYRSENRMLVLGKSAMSSAPAPAPINTPSLRKEHLQEPAPAPTNSPARTGWAVPTAPVAPPLSLNHGPQASESASQVTSVEHRSTAPAPGENVWASGHVAEVINPELAHHHDPPEQQQQQQPAALPESRAVGRATGRFARSPLMENSGRWGDDAVERDIERRDREREARRYREFPDLREAAKIEEQHHHDVVSAGKATAPLRDRPTPQDDRFHNGVDRFHNGGDRFHNGGDRFHNGGDRFHRESDHVDRFHREDDRADESHRPWARAEPQPAAAIPHSRFSPSDARFDGFTPRPQPSVTSSRAGSSHGSSTSASELDVGHRYPSPPHYSFIPEDAHHHHHSHDSSASVAPVQPTLPPSVGPDSVHNEPMNWRKHPTPTFAPRSVPVPERSAAPLSRASSSSSGGVQPATSSPQVRILKRVEAGPKMLFDPKTGGMVSADKDEASRRRRPQPKPVAELKPTVEVKPTIEAKPIVEPKPAATFEPKPTVEAKPVATLIVGDMELPIHHVPIMALGREPEPASEEQPASEATVEAVEVAVQASPASTSASPSVEDTKKPSMAKSSKPAKPAVRVHDRVKAEQHRSRSESTHKATAKGEARHTVSASPSVPTSANAASRSQEKRPAGGKRRQDKVEERRSVRVGNADGKKTERKTKTPWDATAASAKRENRSSAPARQPAASSGPAQPSKRAEKREARARRLEHASDTVEGDDKALETTESGFQTVKSRRVLLTEKKVQRQLEPAVETKASGGAEANGSTPSQRKPRGRRTGHETKPKAELAAEASTEAVASANTRSRRLERQAGGEQASESTAAPRTERIREPKQQRTSKGEQGGAASKPRGKRDAAAAPQAVEAADGASSTPPGSKQTSDKRKPRGGKAGKPRGERQARPTSSEAVEAPGTAAKGAEAGAVAAASPPSKTPGKSQRKPSVRKVYVVKATPASSLSAA